MPEEPIYSVGGVQQIINGVAVADAYVYDPASATWSAFAPLPQPLEAPTAAFLDGTMYVAGGWNNEGVEQSTLYAYHPSSDTWAQVADLPQGAASGSTAVLDGSLYVIGGCTQECSALLNTVYRYSPSSNVWTAVAHYPVTVQWLSCAGVVDEVVCAGGDTWDAAGNVESLASTYIYHPRQNTWTQGADMPNADWGMASSGANGELQVVGGIISGPDIVGGIADTNQAEQFDPAHDVWSALPDALFPIFRGGGAGCGMSQIGGSTGAGLLQFPSGNTVTEVLPGFDQCGGDQVPWLSTDRRSLELAPGQSVRVRVTADAAQLEAPGDYAAELTFTTDTPYAQRPVTVKLDAAAPSSWGEISGTVTAAGSGAPLAGATVRICAAQDAKARQCRHPLYSTTTDSQGSYAVWLPGHGAPLVVSASIAGYRAQIQEVAEKPGGDSVAAFMLTTVS